MKKPSLSELTLREKIGQTVCMNPNVMSSIKDPDEYYKDNPIANLWTAGFIKMEFVNLAEEPVSDGEGEELDILARSYAKHVSSLLKTPFLQALDAENGLKPTFPYFSTIPNSTAIGATGDPEYAYKYGKAVAGELKAAGARWLWSPVCDNPSPLCSVSLTRGFSDDVDFASKMIAEYVKGVQSENVAATLKHFPGADKDEYRDSHLSDQYIRQSVDEWYERQGRIFKAGIDAGVYSVMISHCSFPAADDTLINGKRIPATVSKKIITGLLKEKLGFKGVVITDGIGMRGLTSLFTNSEDMYTMVYNAGNDVILGPREKNFIDIIVHAVESGKIPESRIDDACQRVLDMKEKLGLFDDDNWADISREERKQAVENTEKVNDQAASKIITWLARKNNLIPLDKNKIKKVHLVYIGYSPAPYNNLKYVKEAFEEYGATVTMTDGFDNEDLYYIKRVAEENDLIIYFAHLAPHQPLGIGGFIEDKARYFVQVLEYGEEKSICTSTSSPYIYNDWFPAAQNFINLYCAVPSVLKTFVKGLYGDAEFTGVTPFNPDPLAPRL